MSREKIHIVGLGVAEEVIFSNAVQNILCTADIIIGSERQLQTIKSLLLGRQHKSTSVLLPALSELAVLIGSYPHQQIVVLASGDPLYYGIGRWFSQNFDSAYLSFYPAVSSIQAACHALRLSLQDVEVISLHGRPLEKIRTKLHRNKQLVILTDKYSQPQVLAKECMAAGFAKSTLTVCENLGYKQQQIRSFCANQLAHDDNALFDPLHVTVINVLGEGGVLPEFPGIPDVHYITGAKAGKGMISKREVRLSILSLLQPNSQDVVWDIGAGCGGVTVELAYWNEKTTVYAIEHHQARLNYLLENCQRFGVTPNVHIVPGRAPDALKDLPAPTKVFIGGSDGELNNLLAQVWSRLPVGGLLVASAVMDSTKKQLTEFAENINNAVVESVEVSIKRGSLQPRNSTQKSLTDAPSLKNCLRYESRLPVEIFKLKKLSLN